MSKMNYEQTRTYLSEIDHSKLVIMCNEIYEWKNSLEGTYDGEELAKLTEKTDLDMREVEELVIDEAIRRYKRVAGLLLTERTSTFIRRLN